MKKQYNFHEYEPTIKHVFIPLKKQKSKPPKTRRITFASNSYLDKLIKIINTAEHTILLSSFLIADEKLENAIINQSEKGVRVYILTSSDAQLSKLDKDEMTEFDQKAVDHHIKLLKKLSQTTLCRSAPHLHAKFLLVDPTIEGTFNDNCIALISTANFTTKAMTINPELIVFVDDINTKRALYQLFLKGFWQEAEQELVNDELSGIKSTKTIPPPPIPNTSKDTFSLRELLLQRIKEADRIIIGAFSLEVNHPTISELLNSNKPLKIYTRLRERNYPALIEFMNRPNTEIMIHRDIHAKFLITEVQGKEKAIVFTANFAEKGLDSGFEVGIDLDSQQISELKRIIDHWKKETDYFFVQQVSTKDLSCDHIMFRVNNKIERKGVIKMKEMNKEFTLKTIRDVKNAHKWLEQRPNFRNGDIALSITKKMETSVPPLPKKLNIDKIKTYEIVISEKKLVVYSPKDKSDFIIYDTPMELVNADNEFDNLKIYRGDN